MGQGGKEFTMKLDVRDTESVGGSWGIGDSWSQDIMNQVGTAFEGSASGGLRHAAVAALVEIRKITNDITEESARH